MISIPLPENHQETNIQLIKLLYNDVKNLASILSCCVGSMCVSSNNDIKPLSLCENCFSLIFITLPENHLRTNKQLY